MGKNANLPFHLYVNVNNAFLGPDMVGYTKGIWHGVYGREYQILLCHVLLETGAHWSGLPLHAISFTDSFFFGPDQLMPWHCMGEDIEVFYSTMLEGVKVESRKPIEMPGRHTGIIIDWKDGYSRYPQEHKPLNLIAFDQGQYALLPNNYLIFIEKHFVNPEKKWETKLYKRGETIYYE